jgi:putative hydrolase of the HAD superfamily
VTLSVVVFDIDDTVYLERDYVYSGFRAVGHWAGERLGVEGFEAACSKLFASGVRGTIFDDALRGLGVEPKPDVIVALREVYRAHDPDIHLEPDAVSVLERLHRRIALSAVSDGPITSQRAKAGALELSRWLSPILFTEEMGPEYHKPSSLAFESLEKQFGVQGVGLGYVADNPAKDFIGPAALGWRTVRVRRPGGLHAAEPSGEDVQAEMTDLRELESVLEL